MAINGLSLYQLAVAKRVEPVRTSAPTQNAVPLVKPTAEPAVIASASPLSPGSMPIDTDRVAQIRRAVESGTYPLVPAKIADAMIAAGMILAAVKEN